MDYIITEKGNDFLINGKIITQEAQEEVGYYIKVKDYFVDDLIDWISEATKDKELMKEDLKWLMFIEDNYILSSNSTNEYYCYSEDEEDFTEILMELYNH